MKATQQEWVLDGLGCANCARKIESAVQNTEGVLSASLDFVTCKFRIEVSGEHEVSVIKSKVEDILGRIEPGSSIRNEKQSDQDAEHHQSAVLNKGRIAFYSFGVLCFLTAIVLMSGTLLETAFFTIAYLIFGSSVFLKSFRNILKGQVFDENFLMAIASIGAFILGEYAEGAAVMLFYQIGELFQDYAIGHSRKSIRQLMNIKPEFANIKTGSGFIKVAPTDVQIGDLIIICPGERVPLDGTILEGCSSLDTSPLTGESLPRDVNIGDEVFSGSINQSGVLEVQVKKSFGQSAVSRVLALVEEASQKKAVTERFITRFAALYTPIVVGLAALIAILPPIITGDSFNSWLYRALIFLVISCPCALVISIPLGFFGGIGAASKRGILVKGGNYLEALAKAETVVFDKTGTLTKGSFEVSEIISSEGFSSDELLYIAAAVESYSTHPLARSVIRKLGGKPDWQNVIDYREIPGKGVSATVDGKKVFCGNVQLMKEQGLLIEHEATLGTKLYVSVDGIYAGCLVLNDMIKSDARHTTDCLKKQGIKDTVMLTGDYAASANDIAERAGIDRVFSQLLPQDKVLKIEEIMRERKGKNPVVFVGDGINDAAVIARSDIGIAMGGMGSDAAIEAADIVIMNDEPYKLCEAIAIARKTRAVVYQNIFLAVSVKLLVLILGAGGIANMWEAVFADVGVALLAILNAMRVLRGRIKGV